MIVAEYQKKNHHQYLHEDIFFWQDSNANKVDLLVKDFKGYNIYEIKATETIKPSLFEKMNNFENLAAPAKVNKTLIFGGKENQKRSHYNILSWKNSFNTI